MKKLFALILSLCLLCGCTAMAETVISWEDVTPYLEAGEVTGDFYTFDAIAAMIWIPTGMVPTELPDESYIGYFVPEDGSEGAIAVQYVDVNGASLEDYAAILPDVGATGIEMGTLNGLPCVSYDLPETNAMCVAFTTEAGYVMEVIVAPITDELTKLAASVVLASVQPLAE